MLALKSALAEKDDIPTIIYDEIDTGVSGLAAGRIGQKLRQTARGAGHLHHAYRADRRAGRQPALIQKMYRPSAPHTEIFPWIRKAASEVAGSSRATRSPT